MRIGCDRECGGGGEPEAVNFFPMVKGGQILAGFDIDKNFFFPL